MFLYYREKLPRYDIDTSFMFPIKQDNCNTIEFKLLPSVMSYDADNATTVLEDVRQQKYPLTPLHKESRLDNKK